MNRALKRTLPLFLLVLLGAVDLEAMIVRKYPMKEVLKQSQ